MFVVGWFRDYSEFFSTFVEEDAYNYFVLIANVGESKSHLDEVVLVSANDVARYVDTGGKECADDNN